MKKIFSDLVQIFIWNFQEIWDYNEGTAKREKRQEEIKLFVSSWSCNWKWILIKYLHNFRISTEQHNVTVLVSLCNTCKRNSELRLKTAERILMVKSFHFTFAQYTRMGKKWITIISSISDHKKYFIGFVEWTLKSISENKATEKQKIAGNMLIQFLSVEWHNKKIWFYLLFSTEKGEKLLKFFGLKFILVNFEFFQSLEILQSKIF